MFRSTAFRPWEEGEKEQGGGGTSSGKKPLDKGKGQEDQTLPLPPILKKRKRDGRGEEGYWSSQSEVFGDGWRNKIPKVSSTPSPLVPPSLSAMLLLLSADTGRTIPSHALNPY